MATYNDTTFGARLRKAQEKIEYLNTISNYKPPKNDYTVESLQELANNILVVNSKINTLLLDYTLAVEERSNLFKKGEQSLEKRLTIIRNFIQAIYDKNSRHYQIVNDLIHKMRPVSNKKSSDELSEVEATVSKSQLSYGSLIANFQELVNVLKQYSEYNPNNQLIKISELEILLEKLRDLSNRVSNNANLLRPVRNERQNLYNDLKVRFTRIKAYIRADFGIKSTEYVSLKDLKL